MPLSVADIERWDPQAVREVFHAGTARGNTSVSAAQGLGELSIFQSWGGPASDAARFAIGRTRVDLDAHGNEALAVAKAADIAAADIQGIKDQLERLTEAAHDAHLEIDPLTSQVVPGPGFDASNPFAVMAQIELQAAVDGLIADANRVDAELAAAINMADGLAPMPSTPPGNSLSEQQINDMVADMTDGQDLNGPEAQQLSQQLREQLRQASAEGLTPDQAYARAEDFASMYMMNLHRPYVRKATRLQTFADTRRTPAGDFLTPRRNVIPAARDANGDLIWVDKTTGQRVPEGTPGSMTVPERGSYHLGHKYGEENWRALRQAEEEGWTQQELNDAMNRPGSYQVETPQENHSHANESREPYAPNPELTPDRLRAPPPVSAPVPGAGAPAGAPSSPVSGSGPTTPAAVQAPMISPPPDLSLPPHAVGLPPWLQPLAPSGYQVSPFPDPLSPTFGLPMDVSGPPSPPVAPSSISDPGGIDLGFSPVEGAKDVGKGFVAVVVGVGAFLGALASIGSHPTAGAG